MLRLRGEERERRRGDGDRRLRGERLTLRREDDLGLISRDRSRPGPMSGRNRFLSGESSRSASLLLRSGERLRALRGGDLVLEGDCLDVLSEAPGGALWRGEALRRLAGL